MKKYIVFAIALLALTSCYTFDSDYETTKLSDKQTLWLAKQPRLPNHTLTPGVLCTKDDVDFDGYRYDGNVAHCARNVTEKQKNEVFDAYKILKQDRIRYDIDHYIPLCVGGSNNEKNLWPQLISDSLQKDDLERKLCSGLRDGSITQRHAVAMIKAWRAK